MSTSRVCADGLLQQILSTGAARTLPDAAFHRLLPASTAEAAIGSSLTMHLPAPADHLGAAAVVSGVCWRLAALHVCMTPVSTTGGGNRLALGGSSARAARGTAGDR